MRFTGISSIGGRDVEAAMFRDAEDRLKEISAKGDPLETLAEAVDFKRFKPILEKAAGRPRSPKGGRPSFDPILKFKMLVLQSLRGLSLEATENMVRDRPSWMRFCGLEMCDRVPDANTLWDFREALIKAGAFDDLFKELDQAVNEAGYIPRSGQIVDASLISAPRQRNTDGEKAAIKAGRSAGEIWPDSPAKASQKDTDARWMVKHRKVKPGPDGKKRLDIAIPVFGCKTRICIDRKHGFIRSQIAERKRQRRRPAARMPGPAQHRFRRRKGRHGVPLGGEREMAQGKGPAKLHPPQEAERPPHERADRESQRAQVDGPVFVNKHPIMTPCRHAKVPPPPARRFFGGWAAGGRGLFGAGRSGLFWGVGSGRRRRHPMFRAMRRRAARQFAPLLGSGSASGSRSFRKSNFRSCCFPS